MFPLSFANLVQPDLAAEGTVSGVGDVRGTTGNPNVTFDLEGDGLSVAVLDQAGIAPLRLSAQGRFADNIVQLKRYAAKDAGSLELSGTGTIPLNDGPMNVRVNGSAPLSLANPYLASRGATATGRAYFNGAVVGTRTAPSASGSLTLTNGTIVDPLSNLKLNNLSLNANLVGDRLQISRGQANLASGGTVSLGGTIGTGAGFPANLNIQLRSAHYTDGQTFDARASW